MGNVLIFQSFDGIANDLPCNPNPCSIIAPNFLLARRAAPAPCMPDSLLPNTNTSFLAKSII